MGQQCSLCADASSAGLFPSMPSSAAPVPPPTTGYAYLRLDADLGKELTSWVGGAVASDALAEPGPPGSEGGATELHVTVATGIQPGALDAIMEVKDRHQPFELTLQQMELEEDGVSLSLSVGVAEAAALSALCSELAQLEGVGCDDEAWTPRVVAARVKGPGTSAGPELQRTLDLRKKVEAAKRFFDQRSWEAAHLVVVMPPAEGGGGDQQVTVFDLNYKGGDV